MPYVLSLDLGTSSVRAALYDERGEAVPGVHASRAHAPVTTADGGVELDPEELLEGAAACLRRTLDLAGERAVEIAGVGACTFWHSVLGVDANLEPVTPVLTWADTRSVEEVALIGDRFDPRTLHRRTGCPLHTSFLGPRLLWARRHWPDRVARACWWLSPGEFLLARWLGERRCSISMAAGTGLFDQARERWDEELLDFIGIEPEALSPVCDTLEPLVGLRPEWSARFPELAAAQWFPAAGDGACSNLGSGCTRPDRVAMMVGTSAAMRVLRSRSEEPAAEPDPPAGLFKYRLDRRRYVLGGSLSNGGNLFAWMRRALQLPDSEALEAALAGMAPDAHGLTALPFLAGERCPGWRGDARAAFVGLSWDTEPLEIVRAGLEAVALRCALIHDLLRPAAAEPHRLIASGGALLASPAWMRMVADAVGRPLVASLEPEASSRGAALLALEGSGLVADADDLPLRVGAEYLPDPERHERYRAAGRRQAELYRRLLDPPLVDPLQLA